MLLRLATFMASGVWLITALVTPSAWTEEAPVPTIDFNRDVRPILGKCVDCHGPSNGEGLAGLRLDSFDAATLELPSGRKAIVPGKPDESELIKRIHETEFGMMPPESSNKTLSDEEKQILHDWILEGAEFKEHWAFVSVTRPDLPKVKDTNWPQNGIDYFILQKLEERGFKPEPQADKRTLIRRASLDITGLPPTPEEVDAFLNDKSENAFEKVVDRLLDSPRYGERMAMDWMDYARYADSNGYQADYERFQSRWRDWVIEAFNDNMPYDQFTVEQIAGDLLPDATMEQKLATAFNRNHRINTEGGVIAEEWRVENVIDRVETTSAVWLGITSGCARCHDHKYDPLSQKDFYRLYSFFNNVPESGTGEERPVSHPPTMRAPTAAQTARLKALGAETSTLKTELNARLEQNRSKAEGWRPTATLPSISDGLVARYVFAPGQAGIEGVGNPEFKLGRATGSVKTNNNSFVDLGAVGNFERDQKFSLGAWVKADQLSGSPFARMHSGSGHRGWDCSIFDGRIQAHIINVWPENGLKIAAKEKFPQGTWTHVFFTYDGSSKAAGFKMYINGKEAETTVENDSLTQTSKTDVSTKIGRRTDSEFFNGEIDDFAIFDRTLSPQEVAKLASTHPAFPYTKIAPDQRTEEQKQEIVRLWSLENDPVYAEKHKLLAKAEADLAAVQASIPEVMVMEEMAEPRDTFVLERGMYDQHGEKVEAGLPDFLPPMPEGAPNNRLGLAMWIVDDENPLTARVTVNRLWERFFGNGIVASVEDFGTRASFPSHPELLDWLAIEFMDQDWDLKGIVKTIVMSAAYQQSSNITDEKLEGDPENRLISRGPRFRLKGEVVRDQALYVAGLLTEKIGGPSVYPYMPPAVWDETNFYGNLRNYKHATDENLYRRSLYTIWKRTAAPPNMLVFDVPTREICRVQRARTNTPLQALTLMNDVTYVEAARVLAQRVLREGGSTPQARLSYAFELVLSREPSGEELQIMMGALSKRIQKYKGDPEAAKALVSVGEAPLDPTLDISELAAYTISCSTLLNLDETINKE